MHSRFASKKLSHGFASFFCSKAAEAMNLVFKSAHDADWLKKRAKEFDIFYKFWQNFEIR